MLGVVLGEERWPSMSRKKAGAVHTLPWWLEHPRVGTVQADVGLPDWQDLTPVLTPQVLHVWFFSAPFPG